MKIIKPLFLSVLTATILSSCGSTAILSTPIENIDNTPLKISELSESEKHTWGHLDLVKDTIPGMSVNKAYAEIIKGKKGETVIVAVIDSGIDIDHEDLNDVIWTNEKEIPNNGKDDDNNGYIDDIHGWNFLGDGYDEQLEYVRILAKRDTGNPDYARAEKEYDEEYEKYSNYKSNYEQFLQQIASADETIAKHLGKEDYTKDEVSAIKTEEPSLKQSVAVINYVYSLGLETVADAKNDLNTGLEQFNDRLNYYLNKVLPKKKTK